MSIDFFKQRNGYEIDDVWFPRVTTITSLVFKGAPMHFMRGAINWGILVHETIQARLQGEDIEIDPRIIPSIEAFDEWAKQNELVVWDPSHAIEKRVVDRENIYAGTIDIVGSVRGKKGVIELKTSTEILSHYALQTAAYLNALTKGPDQSLFPELTDGEVQTRWLIRIDQYAECRGCLAQMREKHGRPTTKGGKAQCNHQWGDIKGEVECVELVEQEKDLQAFLSAKKVWEWSNREFLGKIDNYPKNEVKV